MKTVKKEYICHHRKTNAKRQTNWYLGNEATELILKTCSTFISLYLLNLFLKENQSVLPSPLATLTRVCMIRRLDSHFSISLLCYAMEKVEHYHFIICLPLQTPVSETIRQVGATSAFWGLFFKELGQACPPEHGMLRMFLNRTQKDFPTIIQKYTIYKTVVLLKSELLIKLTPITLLNLLRLIFRKLCPFLGCFHSCFHL